MTHVAELARRSLVAAIMWCSLVSLLNMAAPLEQIDSIPEFDCCTRLQGKGSGSFRCKLIASEHCPSSLRAISTNQLRNVVLTVQNPAGKFVRGENGLYIDFTNAKTGENMPIHISE
jgi:hypothetical protein